MRPLHVYVAGPIGHAPLRAENIRRGVDACRALLLAGHFPFTPHLHDQVFPSEEFTYEQWMTFDFAWIRRCDALVRLPGVSPGADREVQLAGELGIPVFEGVSSFLDHCREVSPRLVRLEKSSTVSIQKSVIALSTGELMMAFSGPSGGECVCNLSRSEARELMGQIGEALG